jgi:hypothetical protein
VAYGKYTIVYRQAGTHYKVCRLWFGRDGSYYVTAPYHPERRAFLMTTRVNYALNEATQSFEDAIDTAGFHDDERRLKLSHHPDGFVQFSGEGVISGKDQNGIPRGMGIRSWPLDRPERGPAFGIVIRGIESFETADPAPKDAVVFADTEIVSVPQANTLVCEGHYFPGLWRRFIRFAADGTAMIAVMHPARAVISLQAVFASPECERDNFIGLELYTMRVPTDYAPSPSAVQPEIYGRISKAKLRPRVFSACIPVARLTYIACWTTGTLSDFLSLAGSVPPHSCRLQPITGR